MTEIYNCSQQGFHYGNLVFAAIAFILVAGGAATLIYLAVLFFKNKQLKTHGVFKAIVILIVCSVFAFSVIPSNLQQTIGAYYEYPKLLENNAYMVERGKIEDLQLYEMSKGKVVKEAEGDEDSYDFPYGCEIIFYLNGAFFDSYYSYGGNVFSYDDIKLLRNSESVEVKYIIENDQKVILSMSVSDNDGT